MATFESMDRRMPKIEACLKANGLEVIEDVAPISARLIVNTASMKLYQKEINEFLELSLIHI